jgi:outer membrane protein TolC
VAALPPDIDAVYLLPLLSLPPGGLRQLIEAINARGLPSFSLFGRTEVEQGVLAGIGTADFIERAARRTALNVQSILLGQDAGTLPVAFSRGTRLTINMTTARRIGVYPDFSVLTTAELIGEDRVLERVLSLQDAVQEAVHSNRDLAAAERLVTAGEYAVQETRAPLLPQIGLQTQAVIIDEDRALFGTSEGTWNGGANVEQALVSEPLWAQRSIEKHLQEQRRWQRESVRLDVVQDAAIGFLEVLRAKTQERLEKDNLDLTLSNLELARLRVRVGSSSRSDVLRWQAEMSANRIAVINANAQRNLQEIQLNRLLDRPAEEPFDTRETGLDDPGLMHTHDRLRPYVSDPWSFKLFRSWMVQVALRQSPEIKQLDAAIAAQRRLLQSTNRSFWLPQFGLQADWTRLFEEWGANEGQRSVLGLDDTDWSIGVRGSLPLFEGGRRFSARARNNEELLRLRIERDALAQRVEQVLRASLHAAGAARAAIDLSRHAADATQENLELVTDSYSRGVTDILGLLDAQNAALLAEIKASNAIYDYLIQWMRVERAVGKFTFSSTQEEIDAFFAELDAWFDEARQP